ncbi:MAG: AAA family ATPase [Litorimonas sp.]
MKLKCVEISNYRRLRNVRIFLGSKNTVLVGANNSGKTTAVVALQNFLKVTRRDNLSLDDFPLSFLPRLAELGARIEADEDPESRLIEELLEFCPFIDLWLDVPVDEAYRVRAIIPTLSWSGGMLGVRFRLEPRKLHALKNAYIAERIAVQKLKEEAVTKGGDDTPDYALWPNDLTEYLSKHFSKLFVVRPYVLDPSEFHDGDEPKPVAEKLQMRAVACEEEPLKGLVQIDEISAQRGFGVERKGPRDQSAPAATKKLSTLVSKYWSDHLDPTENPSFEDLEAMRALQEAQKIYGSTVRAGLKPAISEVEVMGYPGVANPNIEVDIKIEPMEGLNHDAALQYVIEIDNGGSKTSLKLPEHANGLGYQNLIYMVFKLIGYRDAWMRKGKLAKTNDPLNEPEIPLLHLVLIEEPEAYLHTQVQQVFMRQAYEVLRKHPELGENEKYGTQLLISTHSSHIAQECSFDELRYFRRVPPSLGNAPTSQVINLSNVFGDDKETARFVSRYIKVTHCDILFADSAVLMEGLAERVLVPFFIQNDESLAALHQFYISWIEITGSHAHRLRPLIETLGLTTLVICDLDCQDSAKKKQWPELGKGYTSRSYTLKNWVPQKDDLDTLIGLSEEAKVVSFQKPDFQVRAAYQDRKPITYYGETTELLFNTLEDALVMENLDVIASQTFPGTWKKYKEAIATETSLEGLSKRIYDLTKEASKADFALNFLELPTPSSITAPQYIRDGLLWLAAQLSHQREASMGSLLKSEAGIPGEPQEGATADE